MNTTLRARGFSLIELMIAMVIGLIVILGITQAYLASENRRRTIISDNDSQTAGMLTLYMIEREIRNAGFGIPNSSVLGCTVQAAYAGNLGDPGAFPFAPVTITVGANSTPDQVLVLSSTNGAMPLPVKLSAPLAAGDSSISVGVNYFFGPGQLAIIADPANPAQCSLLEIADKAVNSTDLLMSSGPWNQSNAIYPAGGFPSGSFIFNLGSMSLKRFFINEADRSLRVTEFRNGIVGASSSTRILASGIVAMRARYLFDSSGLTGPQQLLAVRLAIVSRGAQAERPATPGAACSATTDPPKWSDGVSLRILDTAPGWQCYRYKVSETTVAVRNRVWNLP